MMWKRFSEAVVISSIGIVMHEHMRQGGSFHIDHVRIYFNDVSVQVVTTLRAQSHRQGWQPLCQLYFEPVREGLLGSPNQRLPSSATSFPCPCHAATCCSSIRSRTAVFSHHVPRDRRNSLPLREEQHHRRLSKLHQDVSRLHV